MTSTDPPPKLTVARTATERPSGRIPMQREVRERIVRLCEAVLWQMARRRTG